MPSGDAFLLDAGEPAAAVKVLEDLWLPRLEDLDDRALEAAVATLDRAAYKAEQAARRIRAHRRARALETGPSPAGGERGTVPDR
jgi:hypothetical protein